MNAIKFILIGLLGLYLLVGLLVYVFQERLIFLPEKLPSDFEYSFDARFREFSVPMNDGAEINALHFQLEEPKGMILYFHGNAGNLDRWGEIVIPLTDLGYEVLIMDYRGYGKSNGNRSMTRMLSDAEVMYKFALTIEREERLIVFGRSLGSAFASHIAGKYRPRKTILETPFYSLCDVARDLLPIYPTTFLLKYNFKNQQSLKTAKDPIYLFHGSEDEVVPYASGKKLFESISSNQATSRFITIEGGHHNDLSTYDAYWKEMVQILDNE